MAKTSGIIVVGNEILSGRVADQNAAFLTRELYSLGIDLRKISIVPDDVDEIAREVASFTSAYDRVFLCGGIGPTHDDVSMAGIARGLSVPLVHHPGLMERLKGLFASEDEGLLLKMSETPEGSNLLGDELPFPIIVVGNLYVFPGQPEILQEKFKAIRDFFRESPFYSKTVYIRLSERRLVGYLNALLESYPGLRLGSYPELSNPSYKVKVVLESKDPDYLESAALEFVAGLPGEAVFRVE